MKLKTNNLKIINSKPYIEIHCDVINDLSSNDFDNLAYTLREGKIVIWKPSELDIPEVIYNELFTLFKGNEDVISRWLDTPKPFLVNKSPIEILETEKGLESILDLINRLKKGDLS